MRLLLVLFFVLMPFAAFSAAAEVRLTTTPNKSVHEITGGTGPKAWKLVYGTSSSLRNRPILLEISPIRAYFAHGAWLRLIDTEKGTVIGRWAFPSFIIAIKPVSGEQVDVVCDETAGPLVSIKNTYRLDPANPQLPTRMIDNLLAARLPQTEPSTQAALPFFGFNKTTPPDRLREALVVIQEQARRDPLSPFFRLLQARLLSLLGDPTADQVFSSVLDVPFTNWIEWLQLSAAFEREGRHDLFERAFERAYAEYWRTGNDPRLFVPLITRLVLFAPWRAEQMTVEQRRDAIDKIYRLSPYGEGAPLAWEIFARELERTGPRDAARLWRERADDARGHDISFSAFNLPLDLWILTLVSSLLAAILYAMVLNRRYTAQNHYDMAAGKRQWTFLNVQNFVYWGRRERFSFIALFLVVWISFAGTGAYLSAMLRIAASPISVFSGSFAGSISQWHLGRLPSSPERDLLLAHSHLRSGQWSDAERMYRDLPQFAESWNDLGVLLQNSGRQAEAKSAYKHALQIDPQLREAEFNLGRGAKDLWTQLHQQYAPNTPMASPPRDRHIRSAYLGGSGLRFWGPALLKGPLWTASNGRGLRMLGLFSDASGGGGGWLAVVFGLIILVFAVLVVVLLVQPYREVTQPPARGQTVLELLFPGTSPAWGALGGIALLAGIALVLQTALTLKFGSARLTTMIAMPNLLRAYVLVTDQSVLQFINPGNFWIYTAPVLLWAINAVLVLAPWRRSTPRPTPTVAVAAS